MPKRKNHSPRNTEVPKPIRYTGKILQTISPKLAARYAALLFTTPIKHKIPKRELDMVKNSKQEDIFIPTIKKQVRVYHYGNSPKKVLLVHGWSGRGTQLVKIADTFLDMGFSTISFDAPAHGKSKGRTTIMTEFITTILELEKQFGTFEYAVGHSLGGMSVLNAVKQNLNIKKAIIIGSGDIIQDIIDDFIGKMTLKPEIGHLMQQHFEKKFGEPMNNYSSYIAAQSITIPTLIIHDEHDEDVPVKAAFNIHENLTGSKLIITKELGHRKILGNEEVIRNIYDFIES